MTRETKIGLLVSLAFVIAVGVLLSDHMVNNTDARPLPVADAGPDVAQGLAVPGLPPEGAGAGAPLTAEANPVPPQTVPTVAEITSPVQEQPTNTVVVGPAPAPAPTGEIEIAVATPNVPQHQTEIRIAPPAENLAGVGNDPGAHVLTLAETTPAPVGPVAPLAEATQPVQKDYQEYVAAKGDHVAKMAKRFLGADTKANRDLIIAANESLKKDPSKVVVGKTYRIPVKSTSAVAATPAPTPELPTLMVQRTQAAPAPAPAPARTYVVKSGDSLWKIARGNPKLVSEIRKLNRDTLKGDALKVGATLRLPTNSANL